MTTGRRGVILPIVLLVLLLLGLLCAMFAFRVNADLAATQAQTFRLQTRLAAEAGVDRVKLLLRTARLDTDRWYHNPDELHRIIVWAYDIDPTMWGTDEELDEGAMAYRFSIVADEPREDEDYIRIGITDESSKLNLNEATKQQLAKLVRMVITEDEEEIIPHEIVAAILDWRDADTIPQSEVGDTEGEYYLKLAKPYRVKNGPFDSVEELLLVKGVTGAILYGEDFDRNGLLTDNEDDGEDSFPPDNEDNLLNRGLYPYLTVHSYESNVSNDNRQRIYLLGSEESVRKELDLAFEDEPDVVDYIVTAARGGGGGAQGPQGGPGGGPNDDDNTESPDDSGESLMPDDGGSTDNEGTLTDPKAGPRKQVSEEDPEDDADGPESAEEGLLDDEMGEAGDGEPGPGGEEETDDAGGGLGPMRSPAELLREQTVDGSVQASPLGLEHLAVLMDRTTLEPPEKQELPGLINVNTAPPPVLRCIEELTGEQIEAILETRSSLDAEQKATTAWLIVEEVLDLETYYAIAPKITARGQQFMIESLGYADHIGMVTRLQVIVDLVGPIAQTIYYRDLTYIGSNFPIREEDEESVRVR